ncbi:hypothetical protein FBY23_1677 [Nocardioides sp. SLBN-35]|nr:hypothetical protein FBY23_1677 [Nocardioides sp. SLBN-35]
MAALQARSCAPTPPRVGVGELITAIPPVPITPEISTDLFNYSLRALNRFLAVYMVATEDSAVHPVVIEHLGPEIVLALRRRRLGANRKLILPNFMAPPRGMQSEHPDHLLGLLPRLLRSEPHNHPLDQVRRLKLRAHRLFDGGEHDVAVVVLQSSAERLVHALHFLIRVDQDCDRQSAEEMVDKPFKTALARLGEELGGNWQTKSNGPVKTYWSDLYELRGRLIHGGHSAERDAVIDAFAAYDGLWRHALKQALAVRRRLPRTALALHGGIGLKEAGALDAFMRQFVTDIEGAGEDYTFWLPRDER